MKFSAYFTKGDAAQQCSHLQFAGYVGTKGASCSRRLDRETSVPATPLGRRRSVVLQKSLAHVALVGEAAKLGDHR